MGCFLVRSSCVFYVFLSEHTPFNALSSRERSSRQTSTEPGLRVKARVLACITPVTRARSPSAVALSLFSVAASGTRCGLGFAPAHGNAGKGPLSRQPSMWVPHHSPRPEDPSPALPRSSVQSHLPAQPLRDPLRSSQGAALNSPPANSTFSSQLGTAHAPTGSSPTLQASLQVMARAVFLECESRPDTLHVASAPSGSHPTPGPRWHLSTSFCPPCPSTPRRPHIRSLPSPHPAAL